MNFTRFLLDWHVFKCSEIKKIDDSLTFKPINVNIFQFADFSNCAGAINGTQIAIKLTL